MTLVPVEGTLGALSKAFREDPDAGQELLRFALFEATADQADRLRDRIQHDVVKNMSARSEAARRALVRSYISKRLEGGEVEEHLEQAARLAVVDAYVEKFLWNKQDHPRDPTTGRFTRKLQGAPGAGGRGSNLHMEASYHEAGRVLDEWRGAGVANDQTWVIVEGRKKARSGKGKGKPFSVTVPMPPPGRAPVVNDPDFIPERVSLDVNSLNLNSQQRAVVDVVGTVASPEAAGRLGAAVPSLANAQRDANAWVQGTPYSRLNQTGRMLSTISAPGSAMNIAGGVAELVGELGPEAEKIIGPGVRRTAYRYRGTERRPDRKLAGEVGQLGDDVVANLVSNPETRERLVNSLAEGAGGRGQTKDARSMGTAENPLIGTLVAYSQPERFNELVDPEGLGDDLTDSLAMKMRADVATAHLLSRVPDMEKTRISRKAGKMPPSQGVIIDADGDVVVDAVGFNGDHYLPFDLKNLKRLDGGQYVRTRAAGGPTSEDIYTGLLGNVRQFQVVSNSGVFTVELDPDLRGGRRYSDKARQMVGRYQALLETINNAEDNDLWETDLDPGAKAEIRQRVLERYNFNAEAAEKPLREELRRARAEAQMSNEKDQIEAAGHKADNEVRARQAAGKPMSNQEAARYKQEYTQRQLRESRESSVRSYRLDGEGYKAALDALAQEFPQYIRRVQYEPVRDFTTKLQIKDPQGFRPSPDTDRGFVPKGNVTFNSDGRGRYSQSNSKDNQTKNGPDQAGGLARSSGTPPKGPSSGGAAGSRLQPNDSVRVDVIEGTPLSDITKDNNSNLMLDLADNYTKGLGAIFKISHGDHPELPEDVSESKAHTVGTPIGYVKYLRSKFGDRPHDVIKHLAENPARAQRVAEAAQMLPTVLEDLDSLDLLDEEAVEQVQNLLTVVERAGNPFRKDVTGDPALISPQSPDDRPLPFTETVQLNSEPENFDRFRAAASKQSPGLAEAITELEGKGNPTSDKVRQFIADEVRAFKNTQDWGQKLMGGRPDAKPNGKVVTDQPRLAQDLARPGYENMKEYQRLQNLQRAWSFLHSEALARSAGGGGSAPKPPVPGPAKKSLGRKVLMHPPGSPLAVLLSKRLASERR